MMAEKVDRPNTLIATVPEDLSGLSRAELVDKLVTCLGADVICCIQFVPKCYARITFTSSDARNQAFLSGIYVDSTRLYTVEADPTFKDVYLEHLPVEVPDDAVLQAFGPFGAVHDITHLKYAGTEIYNGTRLLRISLASDVPVNIRILRYPCRVFYKGQPRPCSICRSSDHRAMDCPLRDVCRRCREPGHFARNCNKVLDPPPVPDPPIVPPSVPDPPNVPDPVDPVPESSAPAASPRRSHAAKRPRSSSESSDPSSFLVTRGYSKYAIQFQDGDTQCVLDMRRMTRRIVDDTATQEMYRECHYNDAPRVDGVPTMTVFPCGRPPPPPDIVLSPDVAPCAFPGTPAST